MDVQKLIVSEIFKKVVFTLKEEEAIFKIIRKIELNKGDVLIKTNQKTSKQYYVSSGCLRSFYIDKLGKDYTVQFAINDWWISDFTSLFTKNNSILTIETIEKATLYEFSKNDLEDLYVKIPKLETFFRKKMEIAFASFQKRILESLSSSAEERYISFKHKYPTIEKKVKNYHIASYLGITSESLSRIRKGLKKD
ncbi:MAG: Crp/Fnr family transcriptional regulator [Polaribacter sp.]